MGETHWRGTNSSCSSSFTPSGLVYNMTHNMLFLYNQFHIHSSTLYYTTCIYREESKQMEETSTSKQLELTRQQEQVRQLQTQLDSASRESESLRLQLEQLRTDRDKIAAENSENAHRLGALEVEKDQLHRELSSSREEVGVLRGSLAEVEGEKGRVLVELQMAQREVEVVMQRNAEMAQVRDSQGDEMEELKLKNTHLIQKVQCIYIINTYNNKHYCCALQLHYSTCEKKTFHKMYENFFNSVYKPHSVMIYT